MSIYNNFCMDYLIHVHNQDNFNTQVIWAK